MRSKRTKTASAALSKEGLLYGFTDDGQITFGLQPNGIDHLHMDVLLVELEDLVALDGRGYTRLVMMVGVYSSSNWSSMSLRIIADLPTLVSPKSKMLHMPCMLFYICF